MLRGWWPVCLAIVLLGGPWPPASLARSPAAEPAKAGKEDDYELQRILVDTLDQVQRNYVREVSRRKLVEAAIKGILSELDPYSAYISPEEMDRFRTTVESEFGGIGIQITDEDGPLRVHSPLVGTPAYRAGLMAGDQIVEIEGQSTRGMSRDEAVRRLKGKAGTSVTLTVIHSGKAAKEKVTLTRELIHIDTVLGDRRKPNDQWEFMLDPQKGIGYVRLSAFSRETAQELRRALEDLKRQNLRGLIVDLRFNPGGLLTSAVEVSGLFISKGRIVSTVGRNVPERVWEARKEGAYEGFPMAILVNRYSASASEIVSACLQDHHRAVVIGERTWGKGSVQNVIPLDEGPPGAEAKGPPDRPGPRSALKLTTAGYRRPSGKNIDRLPGAKESDAWGVLPDPGFEVKLSDKEMVDLMKYRHERDVVLPKKPPPAAAAKPAPPQTAPAAGDGQTKKSDAKAVKSSGPSEPAKKDAGPPTPSKTDGKPPAPSQPASANPSPPFVDRQLQKAIEYLTTELARAK
jgi:carboxyl-terminal processing protease